MGRSTLNFYGRGTLVGFRAFFGQGDIFAFFALCSGVFHWAFFCVLGMELGRSASHFFVLGILKAWLVTVVFFAREALFSAGVGGDVRQTGVMKIAGTVNR